MTYSENEHPDEEILSVTGDEDFGLQQQVQEASGVAPPSPEKAKLKELDGALAKKTEAHQQLEKKHLYLLAEFENYKKRVQKEQVEQAKFANEKLLKEMLVVIDDLERALIHSKIAQDSKKIVEGVDLVLKQFLSCFSRQGVTPMESLGAPFNPEYHQAVGYVERPHSPADHVVEEVQRGYLLNGRVLRAAMVLLAQKGVAPEERAEETPSQKGIIGEDSRTLGESIDMKA